MSGQMKPYDIFMASPKTVGKDRRGNFIYKRDNQGREIINRSLYQTFAQSTILDFLPTVDTGGRIVDDELPLVAQKYLKIEK